MKVAVFSDIHSNYYAFKACFDDARNHQIKTFIFLGDFVSDVSFPEKTMDLIYHIKAKYQCYFVRGNREGYLLEAYEGKRTFKEGSSEGSLLFTYQHLRKKDFEFFKSLPFYRQVTINGLTFEIAHSSHRKDKHNFLKNKPSIEPVFQEMKTNYLLTGHSHVQYIDHRDNKTIINPGSIGIPLHYQGKAQYAIINIENLQMDCYFRKIQYSLKATIIHQFESGLVQLGKYWALAVLYSLMTGKDMTIKVLIQAQYYARKEKTTLENNLIWQTHTRI